MIPIPSSRIFTPISISIIPPHNPAFDLYLSPNILPIFTPAAEQTNVIQPMNDTAGIMFTLRNASETPTASASMLVATAK